MQPLTGARVQAGTKICRVCGCDVSHSERVKDKRGNYYCKPCYARGLEGQDRPQPKAPSPDFHAAKGSPAVQAVLTPAPSIRPRITCPHCWHHFPTDQILWIAQHVDLLGDPVLGREAHARFLPTRFTVDGEAIDARGMACQQLACPRCHLVIPRCLVEAEPLLLSIIGVPASGKSYFLTSLTWELRRQLPLQFALTFNDADTVCNVNLNDYEETLFLQPDPEKLIAIRKTDVAGTELYDEVMLGQQRIMLPKPYLFNLRPAASHPNAPAADKVGRVLCLYDNAGEHFRPGEDSASSPVTQHLARSKVLMFLYDPTKDPRFRERCRPFSSDPQLAGTARTERQETILTEAAMRVRRYAALPPNKKHDRPLIVIVPKSDVWDRLLDGVDLSKEPVVPDAVQPGIAAVDVRRIEEVSRKLRQLLLHLTPEFVAAAEDFCEHVVYVPVNVFARSPVAQPDGFLYTRPADVRPRWATVPVLYMFAKWSTGMVADVAAVQRAGRAPVVAGQNGSGKHTVGTTPPSAP